MQDHAGCVNDAAQRRRFERGEGGFDPCFDREAVVASGADGFTKVIEHAADFCGQDMVRKARGEGRREAGKDFVDGGDVA
jgi:hypothetical protein